MNPSEALSFASMKSAMMIAGLRRDGGLLDGGSLPPPDIFCPGTEHIIVASRQTRRQFRHLESEKRKILCIEDVIAPLTWRAPVNYRKRELYFYKGLRPVDGWVMQQLVKLAAPDFTRAELLLNLDSDVFFCPAVPGTGFRGRGAGAAAAQTAIAGRVPAHLARAGAGVVRPSADGRLRAGLCSGSPDRLAAGCGSKRSRMFANRKSRATLMARRGRLAPPIYARRK